MNPHVCPFVSVDNSEVLDTKLRRKFMRLGKALMGNYLRYTFK